MSGEETTRSDSSQRRVVKHLETNQETNIQHYTGFLVTKLLYAAVEGNVGCSMQTGGAGNQTTDLLSGGSYAFPPEQTDVCFPR